MGCSQSGRIKPSSEAKAPEMFDAADPALLLALRNMQKQASSKNANTVEVFLKSCFSQINRQEAMRTIAQNARAKENFVKFLREEYFVGMPNRFREAVEVLDYEMYHEDKLTVSMRLGLASSRRRQILFEEKMENICDLDRYNEIVNNLATDAFAHYLGSRMYKHWRAYEKGAISSLRARVISVMTMSSKPIKMSLKLTKRSEAKQNDQLETYIGSRKAFDNAKPKLSRGPSFNLQSNSGEEERQSETDRVNRTKRQYVDQRVPYSASAAAAASDELPACPDSETISSKSRDDHQSRSRGVSPRTNANGSSNEADGPTPALLVRTNSFAEKAFTSASIDEKDTVLLMGSTWVAMLIAGIESVPLSFCLLSADPKYLRSDKAMFPFVYVNAKFECDFGYVRENIIGRSYKYLFQKSKTASASCRISSQRIGADGQSNPYYAVDEEEEDEWEDFNLDRNCDEHRDRHTEESHRQSFDESLLEARGKVIDLFVYRGNGKKVKTILCTKPIFDQRDTFRYMMCLSVCMHDSNSNGNGKRDEEKKSTTRQPTRSNPKAYSAASAPNVSSRRRGSAERAMMKQIDFAMLIDLMDSLPNKFEDMNLH